MSAFEFRLRIPLGGEQEIVLCANNQQKAEAKPPNRSVARYWANARFQAECASSALPHWHTSAVWSGAGADGGFNRSMQQIRCTSQRVQSADLELRIHGIGRILVIAA